MGRGHARLPSDDDTDSSGDGHSSASSRSSRSTGSRSSSDRDTDDDAQGTDDEEVEEHPRRHRRRSNILLVVLLLLLLCGALGVAGWLWWTKSGSSSTGATDAASTVTATASPAASENAVSSDGETGQSTADALATGGAGAGDSLNLCWAYNWASTAGGSLGDGVMYVPMLWGSSDQYTKDWDKNARAAISVGATHVFGFNEPDLAEQSNISPKDAADAWKQHIQPLAGLAKLVSPGVTNGVKTATGAPMGIAWLKEFIAACDGCTIDAVALHWYDAASNTAYFTSYLEQAYKNLSKPIWLTEFMGTGSPTDQATFLKFADPWLEKQTFIEKYGAFGDFASNPVAVFVDKDGTPNDLGKVYAGA
ncbi:Glycosyl hydrolase catalytic core-domain containing protein [Rhodotorula toruloides]|uniref:Glycosyl hydrolase catalytic core-domain containing protein n=2 Tax=Rhodotorula toruloides TaxID=5286 RepID=A0A2T0AAQ9_RHOTO|nr:Glycosyl hydrolase catalytic core-domain containing protein [Rhodotorula toruloides]